MRCQVRPMTMKAAISRLSSVSFRFRQVRDLAGDLSADWSGSSGHTRPAVPRPAGSGICRLRLQAASRARLQAHRALGTQRTTGALRGVEPELLRSSVVRDRQSLFETKHGRGRSKHADEGLVGQRRFTERTATTRVRWSFLSPQGRDGVPREIR